MTSNTSFKPLLACKVSFEKSADSLMGTPLWITVSFSLAAFKILSLCLILANVIMMCLGYVLSWAKLFWDSLSFLGFLEVYFLGQNMEVLPIEYIMNSNKFSISCSSSFLSGTSMFRMLEHLMLSRRFLSLSSFF